MECARILGRQLAVAAALPASLADVAARSTLAKAINPPISWDRLGRLKEIVAAIDAVITDVGDPLERLGIALRLWAGCMSAAKTIAATTMDGANTPEGRAAAFVAIDALADADELYAAGVEAAPAFKALHEQEYFFAGVPETSRVRRHPNDFQRD